MDNEVPMSRRRQARAPHELFLTNLIGNHILWFVASLGVFNSYWQPLALVPVSSLSIISYTLWRARVSIRQDHEFVQYHWKLAARRSKFFLVIVIAGLFLASLGWIGYSYFQMKKVLVIALVGGLSQLPLMVSVIVLIVLESEAMHRASNGEEAKKVPVTVDH